MIKKTSPLFYEHVGKHIKKWAQVNYGSQKALARKLDISEYVLSRYISGSREMPAKIITRLTALNFSTKYFTDYYIVEQDRLIPESLDKEDLIKLVFEYQLLIKYIKEIYGHAYEKMNNLQMQNEKLVDLTTKLYSEVERLTAKLKEAKKG